MFVFHFQIYLNFQTGKNAYGKMSKRPAESGDSGSQPPIKKVQFEPILIGPISTLEEMDMKVLQFQNKKLAQVSCQIHIYGIMYEFAMFKKY